MNIPTNHPRYRSLMTREALSEMVDKGLVTQTGLISHGRGEAFDYLMGERSLPSSLRAERAAAAYLLRAKNPVVCVNGNAAALDPGNLISLAREVPAKIEVNIFHRTEKRMELLISHMEENGAEGVLGRDPDARIPGLDSDRALCTRTGIYDSDVILVPIEDGDRAKALADMGKTVISIDLNPLSRTSKAATVSISDEMTRALENIIGAVREMKGRHEIIEETITAFSNENNRKEAVEEICSALRNEMKGGA
ncbi:MAG: phosphopantothenate/pantothenate synthetase [Methanomassiliicoccaceae archaeon]|nr:phosphopantothenate/pantothenate synthetase [Methanomassiliicoccaceae archaeon]